MAVLLLRWYELRASSSSRRVKCYALSSSCPDRRQSLRVCIAERRASALSERGAPGDLPSEFGMQSAMSESVSVESELPTPVAIQSELRRPEDIQMQLPLPLPVGIESEVSNPEPCALESSHNPQVSLDSLDNDCLDALIAFGIGNRDLHSIGRPPTCSSRAASAPQPDSSELFAADSECPYVTVQSNPAAVSSLDGEVEGVRSHVKAGASEAASSSLGKASEISTDCEEGARSYSFALGLTSKRYRMACQRRVAQLWISKEVRLRPSPRCDPSPDNSTLLSLVALCYSKAINMPIARYYPVGATGSPLHLAAASGMEEVAKVLIALGANMGSRDSSELTPIDAAQKNGCFSMMTLLLSVQAERELLESAPSSSVVVPK